MRRATSLGLLAGLLALPALARLAAEVFPAIPPVPGLTAVAHLNGTLPVWEEHDIERPSRATTVPYDFTVYRVP